MNAMLTKSWKLVVATAVFCVATTSSPSYAASQVKGAKSVDIAVFVGNGARNIGAFRWIEIATRAKGCTATLVDGEAVRNGALDKADVLVVPGGWSGDESKDLGESGREMVRAFVRRGGGYIGTCAGCCLAMESAGSHKDMLNMIPFTFGPAGGAATMPVKFNKRAQELCGIKLGVQKIRYHGGPVLMPSRPVADANVDVIAVYAGDINAYSDKPRPSMAGQAAVVAGTYGKGRLFVSAVHPESDVHDHEILRRAFRYVVGREVTWDYPQRKRGQLSVGFVTDHSFGVATARLVHRLVTEGEFDVVPISAEVIAKNGALRHLDAVLAPGGCPPADGKEKPPKNGLYGDNLGRTREFIGRGGRVFAWGSAAEAARAYCPEVACVKDAEAALAALRAFAAEPVPPPPPLPAKVANPLRAGLYHDKSGGNGPIAEMLAISPEYELVILSAADYGNGGLDGIDLLVQPGGSCMGQYNAMGTNGVVALRNFILGGGRYYGVCAGAFMGTQLTRTKKPRLGLVPFRDDAPAHYRGGGPIKIELTKEGQEVFEGSAKHRVVGYFGGPVLIPGDPVENTDVKVLATYVGRTINNASMKPVEPMNGKAAFVGGTVGRGRVFLSCPHPEFTECTYDMVRSGIKYLTGVAPSPVNRDRVRGAVSVLLDLAKDNDSHRYYYNTFMRDRRFDVRTGVNANQYPHADAVVFMTPDDCSMGPSLRRFVRRGGTLVVVARTDREREAAAKIAGAKVVGALADIPDAVLGNPAARVARGKVNEDKLLK